MGRHLAQRLDEAGERSAWSRSASEPAITPTVPQPRADEAAKQRAGRATGGEVRQADIMVPPRGRHIGHQGDDLAAGQDERVDGLAHRGMIERHDREAVVVRAEPRQLARQHRAVEHVDMDELDIGALLGHPRRRLAHRLGELAHEHVVAQRQHEAEAPALAARQRRGGTVRPVAQALGGVLDLAPRLLAHARSAVEGAIGRREADPGGPGDIFECTTRHGWSGVAGGKSTRPGNGAGRALAEDDHAQHLVLGHVARAAPCRRAWPFFITATRSARSNTSWMSWLIRKMPMPFVLELVDQLADLLRSPAGPSAAVGSSMIRMRALKWIARAIATAWRWPPESALHRLLEALASAD